MFIAFEGIDACGKATQAKRLAEQLVAPLFSFPNYNSPTGKLILWYLKEEWCTELMAPDQETADLRRDNPHWKNLGALVFQSLQFANRLESAPEIAMHLRQEKDVICDRYIASALVYGKADGLDQSYLFNTQKFLPQPDLNILLDIDPAQSFERRPERRDSNETNMELLTNVASGYRKLWVDMQEKEGKDKWVAIDGRPPEIEVAAEVRQVVKTERVRRELQEKGSL